MTSLLLSVGIAVFFLTVWGAVMAGAYMLGRPVQVTITPNLAANAHAPASSRRGAQGDDSEASSPDARS